MLPTPSGTFLLGFPSLPSPTEPPTSGGWTPLLLVSAHPGPLPSHAHSWTHTASRVSTQFPPLASLSSSPRDTRHAPPPQPPGALRHLLMRPGGEADLDLGAALPLLPGELGAWTGPWLEGTGEALIDTPLPQTFAYHHSFWAGGEGEGGMCFSRLGFYELSR